MKILLFGKNGQLGWELQRSLAPLGDLVALDRNGSGSLRGDLTDRFGLINTIHQLKPDVIVNAAAYTDVDKAESERDLAGKINVEAPRVMATTAERIGAWLVHYSTDYVFDGSGQMPWKETDTPRPLSVYGATKLEGERMVVSRCTRHLVFRTSWVYSTRGKNFVKTMLNLARQRDTLRVISDQIGAPTGAELIADVTAHALKAACSHPEAAGLYHLAASGETSWHACAIFAIECARALGKSFSIKPGAIQEILTSEYSSSPARRPANSRLDTRRIKETFNLKLPDWRVGVERMILEIFNESGEKAHAEK
ncbi:MAG: dTDP-4-dehydrorhamnose reductase [Candidatus Accumulibacter sp.]|jgi:dTDP-4-dehydrorhamnose reductase|nr:dTDP-4-dehydrorhamnose reductase [Accumulibacter sp.]